MQIESLKELKILDLSKVGNWGDKIENDFNSEDWCKIEKLILPDNVKVLFNFGNGFTGLREIVAHSLTGLGYSFNNSPNLRIIRLHNHIDGVPITDIMYSFKESNFDLLELSGAIEITGSFYDTIYVNTKFLKNYNHYWKYRGEVRIESFNPGGFGVKLSSNGISVLGNYFSTKLLTLKVSYDTQNLLARYYSACSKLYTRYIIFTTDGLQNSQICIGSGFSYLPNLKYVFVPKCVHIDLLKSFISDGENYGSTIFFCEDISSLENIELTIHTIQKVSDEEEARNIIYKDMETESKIALSALNKAAILGVPSSSMELHPSFVNRKGELESLILRREGLSEQEKSSLATKRVYDFLNTFTFKIENIQNLPGGVLSYQSIAHSNIMDDNGEKFSIAIDEKLLTTEYGGKAKRLGVVISKNLVEESYRNKVGLIDRILTEQMYLELHPGDSLSLNNIEDCVSTLYGEAESPLCAIINGKPVGAKLLNLVYRNLISVLWPIYVDYFDSHMPIYCGEVDWEYLAKYGNSNPRNAKNIDKENPKYERNVIDLVYHDYNIFDGTIVVLHLTTYISEHTIEETRLLNLRTFLHKDSILQQGQGPRHLASNMIDNETAYRAEVMEILSLKDWTEKYSNQYKDLMENLRLLYSAAYGIAL